MMIIYDLLIYGSVISLLYKLLYHDSYDTDLRFFKISTTTWIYFSVVVSLSNVYT